MADNLIFPIKFDLEAAVREAQGDADKYLRQLENTLRQKPIRLDVAIDGAAPGSIDAISKRMSTLSQEFNKLTEAQRIYNRASGEFSPEAQKIINEYAELTAATQTYAQSLSQITAAAKRQTQEQMKAQEQEIKRYEEYWKRKEAENAKQAQQEVANAERARKAQQQRISQEQAADAKRYQEWLRQKNQEAVETERVERQKQQSRERTIAQQNREFAAQRLSEQQRQQAISASLRAEYQRIEAKKQAEAASRRELQLLNQQYAAEERRQRLAASQASIAKRQQVVKTLRAEENTIVNITAKLQHWQQVMNSSAMDGRQFKRATEEVQRLSQKLSEAQARISQLTATTSNASTRQSAAVRQVSQEFKKQDGYVSRLLKRMAVYASFSYVRNILTSIREVTAEFELQRISLGAIIQDQQKANQIFAEIKSFALTSPLKILDLTKYAKQVAAYGFAADRVFDVTKRLADISVGLGVDMGRLTLAVSQIRAATVLKSSELRQLTETGLPMLDLLSKKLTETQGKLVSAADVMDLISKRAISYEMVEEILYDLTDAGGMFYNMQIKQSQTLFGMWSKLGDAAAIMYDQIGNTSSINAGMKLAIQSIESLMRNWKTTARVLDSVAVATAVYIVGLKSAAVASKAVTLAEAQRLAVEKGHLVITPKVITAIIGKGRALDLSIRLTNLHTAAMVREATATNILTKGFWRLTAAMLANPWVAAASAIALIGVALFHFIGNTETAAERAEKLNNSVASLKNLDDTTKPLIDTYNELINKTERTAEEQKKLSEVTHELAKQYPGAITAIGNFGTEVELAADKLNQLYQAEKQARMDNTRHELQETEKQIKEVEAEIEKYQQRLANGEKTISKRLGDSGLRTNKIVPLTEKDKDYILKQIDELRVGTDGQSGLLGLQQSAEAARRALGLIPSEAAQAVEKFGAWKKTFTTFRQQVGDVRVQLFDDSTINQFGSLEEALKKTAEEYKKNIALVATYDETLKSATLTSEERAKIETEKAEADAMANLAEKALKYYNAMSLLNTSTNGSGRTSDPRLQTLQEIANKMTEVNKEYDELLKKEGQTKALADTQKLFASSFEQMKATAKKYGFKLPAFEVPQTIEDVQKWYKAIMDNIKRLNLKNADKVLIELGFKSDKAAIDKQQKDIEKQIKDLADRISRTKTAKEFYEKILSQTGDVELATRVSLSIYGSTGEELFEDTVKQIREVFKSGNKDVEIDLSPVFDMTNQRIDYKMLADIYDKYQDQIIEKNRSTAENIVKEGQKTAASNIDTWEKELAKAKDYEQQRTDIINRETQRRADIIKSHEYTPEQKEERLKLSQKKQDEDLAKVNFEEFTKSEDYVRIFENLDNVATRSLKHLREELQKVIDTDKDLSPENMKTLVKAMEDIDNEIGERNPFDTLVSSAKEYFESIKNIKIAKQELKAAEEEYKAQEPQLTADIETAKAEKETADKDVVEAQQQLLDIQNQMAVLRAQEIVDERALAELRDREITAGNNLVSAKLRQNQSETNLTKTVQKQVNAQNKVNKAQKKLDKNTDNANKAQNNFLKSINNTKDQIGAVQSAMEALSPILGDLTEEGTAFGDAWLAVIQAMETFQTIMTVVTILQEAFNIATAANPWMAVAAAVLAVVTALSSYISNQKVKKANEEIEKQSKLLDDLEYSYERLEKAMEKSFGSDYIENFNERIKSLQAQAEASQKRADAERTKGKKADEEKAKEYENEARDILNNIEDMSDELFDHILGTNVESAARDFANAWLEAYLSFDDTTQAIQDKFNDMIKNMVVNMALAQVVKNALQQFFDMVEELSSDGLSTEDYRKIFSSIPQYVEDINNGMAIGMENMKAAGLDVKSLRGNIDGFTGIAKNIAGATSEEINALSAGINTQNYYMSHVPQIAEHVASMRQLMERSITSTIPDIASTGWTDWQQQAMDNYQAIARNTAETVVRCERAAVACEAFAADIHRMIEYSGGKHRLNVKL